MASLPQDPLIYQTFIDFDIEKSSEGKRNPYLAYEYLSRGDRRSIPEASLRFRTQMKASSQETSLTRSRCLFSASLALALAYAYHSGLPADEYHECTEWYLMQCMLSETAEAVTRLHTQMISDLTERTGRAVESGQIILQMKDSSDTGPDIKSSDPIDRAIDYILTHLHERIYLNQLAAYVHLSPNYLSYLFKKRQGVTLQAYIRRTKTRVAANMLLYSDYSLSDIAHMLDFSDESHFIRIFKQETGTTPMVYRTQGQPFSFESPMETSSQPVLY